MRIGEGIAGTALSHIYASGVHTCHSVHAPTARPLRGAEGAIRMLPQISQEVTQSKSTCRLLP